MGSIIPSLASLVGIILVGLALQDAFEVVLLPRPVHRRWRLMRVFFRITWSIWRRASLPFPAGRKRETMLGVYGPASLVMLFGLWAIFIIVGFGLLRWGVEAFRAPPVAVTRFFLVSGDAFFTLGYDENVPHTTIDHLLVIAEAGTGLSIIALTITYLPVLQQHFVVRDVQLIPLAARAGSPPTSVALLLWHVEEKNLSSVEEWLRRWELWSAELIESQAAYPMLAFYRSQHDKQSWLASLTVTLDCCTLLLSGFEDRSFHQAEITFFTARRVLTEICAAHDLRGAPDRAMRDLAPEQYRRISAALTQAGCSWNGDEDAQESIAALRATYEPMLSQLSNYLLLPLPDWISPAGIVPAARAERQATIGRLTKVETIGHSSHQPGVATDSADQAQFDASQRRRKASAQGGDETE